MIIITDSISPVLILRQLNESEINKFHIWVVRHSIDWGKIDLLLLLLFIFSRMTWKKQTTLVVGDRLYYTECQVCPRDSSLHEHHFPMKHKLISSELGTFFRDITYVPLPIPLSITFPGQLSFQVFILVYSFKFLQILFINPQNY